MEKILNDEEKIRRAQELYFRRNNPTYSIRKKENENIKNTKYRIILNLLVMFNLAVIVFCIQNKDFIFTNEFISKIDEYNRDISSKILNAFAPVFCDTKNNDNNENKLTENSISDDKEQNLEEEQNIINEANKSNVENNFENKISAVSEMELDIENLKAAYKFVNPLNGTVSSGFGARESKYQKVSGYHTGVDIAAESGTPIVASMEGIVDFVSNEGDYGKHIKIRCNNVTTLYAHCSKIFVKEGQIVASGQKIANVGNTGNSTGPHLHFEIRVEDRFVDPAKIINF